jgi:DNA-binding SARP family transcriptional activator/ABC-type transport system substrate-binding protein
MEFRLLGPVEAHRDDRPIALGGAKPRALLALLLLHVNEVVSRDRIIESLWSGRAPGTAEHSLDVQVSRLRKALAPDDVLRTRSGGYTLEVEPERIDSRRFERLLEEGRRANAAGRPVDAHDLLEQALGLWRGHALADLAYEDFARTESDRLEELRLVATEERIDADLALGGHDTLIPDLERLAAEYPLRERLRGQLMLALYRAGRQAEALRVYSDTRRRLVEELGIEPGQSLRDLEQAILLQDPALHPPRAAISTTRRRALAGALALALAGVATAVVIGLAQGGTEAAEAQADPDSNVFVSAETGVVVRDAPIRDTARLAYDDDALWSVSADGEVTRLDPESGEIVATLGLGVKPAGLTVGEGSVWVTGRDSSTLFRIDPSVNEVVNPFPLPMKGVIPHGTGEVAVGAGSVWVGHGGENPGAWVERLHPETGRVQHRFPILGGDANHLAFDEGALWVASQASGDLRKIDPRTNKIVLTRKLRQQPCCIAAGGGFVWVAINPDAAVWKVSRDGNVVDIVKLPALIESVRYADDALWVAVGEDGTVVRIDPTTNERRTYEVGHSVRDVDVRDGLVAVGVRQSTQDATAGLEGAIVRVARADESLFRIGEPSADPVLFTNWDDAMMQFQYATCAKLYNYRDVEGERGKTVVPEVAADFPEVSDGGRTYTIRIRDGYRFSPPSNEPVTAASFRRAFERSLSPNFDPNYFPPQFANLVGARAYDAGKARRISGLSVEDGALVIRLVSPAPELPRALALPVFCAVPEKTPVVRHGLETPIPSAGPYYLAAHTEAVAVLKANPNYGGPRPQHLDAIVYEFGIAPAAAAARIEDGTLDYILQGGPDLAPGSAAARSAGPRSRLTPASPPAVHFLAFNTDRPLFADIRMRRAVQLVLDRRELARLDLDGPSLVATSLIPPNMPGFDTEPRYPLRGDLRTARKLAGGRKATAVVYMFDDKSAFSTALREQLAAIGIRMKVLPALNADFGPGGKLFEKASRSDLIWGGEGLETGDLASYLERLYLFPKEEAEVARILKLPIPERDERALALARRVERQSLFAVYDSRAFPELVSRRLGCVVHQPMYPGVDLAALCLKDQRD